MHPSVLVTGGAGFIGSHLVRALLAKGKSVRILDNLDPFYDPAIKRQNIEDLRRLGDLEFIEGDIRDPEIVDTATKDIDTLVHLAALAGVRPSIEMPRRYADVNVVGTQTLLDALMGRPSVKFIFGGSSSVYGGCKSVPFSESELHLHPVSPYAATKLAGELQARTFHTLYGNPVTCLRFFTVYGPGQRPEMAIHKFTRLISEELPLPMFGDGTSERDYTWVGDIVCGVMAAIDKADGFHIYNLGGAATTSLRQLIALIGDAVGKNPKIDDLPDQPGDVPRTFADVSSAERELGYRATVAIPDGIPLFVKWYQAERAAGRLQPQ